MQAVRITVVHMDLNILTSILMSIPLSRFNIQATNVIAIAGGMVINHLSETLLTWKVDININKG
ncbi:hypothetical protein [Haloferax marisrubri]|uniref:hypothetical protein n=1 Tax=Haloferax marisrubri TaxID=1544719 RepID=UPI0018ECBECC|nr:hypothetical protein [Haloferax marisrubri]